MMDTIMKWLHWHRYYVVTHQVIDPHNTIVLFSYCMCGLGRVEVVSTTKGYAKG